MQKSLLFLRRYYEVASVKCTPYAADLVMDVEELGRTIHVEEKKLELLTCAFDEQCLASDAARQMMWPDRYSRTLLRFSGKGLKETNEFPIDNKFIRSSINRDLFCTEFF